MKASNVSDIEEYREREGFSLYSISSHGRVFNKKTGKYMSFHKNGNGYYMLSLKGDNGIRGNFTVHRLVADAFIPKKEGDINVNHKDAVKTNNRLDNLERCTAGENARHAAAMGRIKGQRFAKEDVAGILNLKGVTGSRTVARLYGAPESLVRAIWSGTNRNILANATTLSAKDIAAIVDPAIPVEQHPVLKFIIGDWVMIPDDGIAGRIIEMDDKQVVIKTPKRHNNKTFYVVSPAMCRRLVPAECLLQVREEAPAHSPVTPAQPAGSVDINPVLLNSITQWASDKIAPLDKPGPSMATAQLICIEFLRILKLAESQQTYIKDLIRQHSFECIQSDGPATVANAAALTQPVTTGPSADALRKALGSAKGTLNYIRVQAVAGHPGFNMVAKMNADDAIKKIDAVLEGSHHG